MNKMKMLEWAGVVIAVVYAQLLAYNIGAEVAGFALLLVSSVLLGVWVAAVINHNPGDIVFDPFMGTGTTLAAAQQTGRKSCGIEREANYITAARARITATTPEIIQPPPTDMV